MRGVQAAAAAMMVLGILPLRAAPAWRGPIPQAERLADRAMLDRAAVGVVRAAIVVSLWPPARQCLIGAYYGLPSPTPDARALQRRLADAFGVADWSPAPTAAQPKLRRAA